MKGIYCIINISHVIFSLRKRQWLKRLKNISRGCVKRCDHDLFLMKNYALFSRLRQAQNLRNFIFSSVASRATVIRLECQVWNETLPHITHAGITLSLLLCNRNTRRNDKINFAFVSLLLLQPE